MKNLICISGFGLDTCSRNQVRRMFLRVMSALVCLAVSGKVGAQYQPLAPEFQISINEPLHDDMLSELRGLEEAAWVINDPQGITLQGKGTALVNYVFTKPGDYIVRFTREHQHNVTYARFGHRCDHYALPDQIMVRVNAQKISFDCESLHFSQPIKGGLSADSIIMSIAVQVYGKDVVMPRQIITAGAQTTITGTLNPAQATLSTGQHILQYTLYGQGSLDTYIMFDLPDANGHITSCGIMHKL